MKHFRLYKLCYILVLFSLFFAISCLEDKDKQDDKNKVIGTLTINGKVCSLLSNFNHVYFRAFNTAEYAAYPEGYGGGYIRLLFSRKISSATYGQGVDFGAFILHYTNPVCPVKGDVISDMQDFRLSDFRDFIESDETIFPNYNYEDASGSYLSGVLKVVDISKKGTISLSFENLKMLIYDNPYHILTINGKVTIPWEEYKFNK